MLIVTADEGEEQADESEDDAVEEEEEEEEEVGICAGPSVWVLMDGEGL